MNRAASEGHGLLAESDNEDAAGSTSNWDRVRVVSVKSSADDSSPSRRASLERFVTAPLLDLQRSLSGLPEVATSAHLKYDAEQWLPTIRASFDTVGPFVLQPLLLLTALTAAMTFASSGYQHPPWWTTLPPFAHTVLGGCLSFLMVFRTNTAYSRWWEARLMWGQITITCRSIGSHASSMLVEPSQLTSLLIAFPIVVKNNLRDQPTPSTELAAAEAVSAKASVVPPLATLAASPSPANALIEAMARTARAGIKNDDGLGASAYMHLCAELRSLTQAATACERIKTSPMPLGYVSALRFFLIFWLTTLPLTLIGTYHLAATPAVAVIAFCFLNLENVAMEIEQPFGTDANDLPLDDYCAAIEKVLVTLLRSSRESGVTNEAKA